MHATEQHILEYVIKTFQAYEKHSVIKACTSFTVALHISEVLKNGVLER